ncbi:MAG: aldehyde dehydrogenase family protein [Pseudomonadota bacterium]
MLDQPASPAIKGMYIAGAWRPGNGSFDDLNPSDGALYARIPDGGRIEARAAIAAAAGGFPAWAGLMFTERAAFLLKAAEVWERRAPDYVAAATAEGGGWRGKGLFEAGYVAEVFRAAAAACYAPVGQILPSVHGKLSHAVRQPIGVVSVISPWNMPGILSSRGFAFPLAAGNTVVLKPSEETPYAGGLFFAEVMEEAGLPPGVFNVVTCGRENVGEMGDELVENPAVKGVSFTGSTAVGRHIAAKAGAHLKKACVELGGKDSLIVLEDAEMERASAAASFGAFMHQGQICMSVEKVLVQEAIYQPFLEAFVARARKLRTGDVADPQNVVGPLINDRQAARVAAQIEEATARGATLALGGGVRGRYVEPTILTGVTPEMAIWREETFGPVAVVVPFRTDADAIALNNDTEYGLSSGIITADEERALAMAARLETGMCHVNCTSINDEPHVPFGGTKASGLGRHGGLWSMETFTETRWITLDRGHRPYPGVF